MRRLALMCAVTLLAGSVAACGDDTKKTPGTDTTSDATDTVSPGDTTGDTVAPGDTTPGDTTPGDTTPGDTTAPGDTTPGDTTPVDCVDDEFAGTEASPADLTAVDGKTFRICPDVVDVFSVTATAGEILKISMVIDAADPEETTGGVDDLDMYLYKGSIGDENEVASSLNSSAFEDIAFTVTEAGTYILVVEGYDGSSADYTLSFSKAMGCKQDSDCSGGQSCFVGVDSATMAVVQECRTYTAPSCGQSTAEDAAPDSHSGATAKAFDAIATDGSFTGKICAGDIDVFKMDLAAGETLLANVAGDLPEDVDLVVTFVSPGGVILDVQEVLGKSSVDVNEFFTEAAGTYYMYLDFLDFRDTTGEVDYTIKMATAGACRVDGDCLGGQVCGITLPASGPTFICAAEKADECGSDTDNSRTNAQALTSGTQTVDQVNCAGNMDWYKIELSSTSGRNNLTANITWTTGDDFDLYVVGPDGVGLGAGWYGNGTENIKLQALPNGTYYLLVDLYDYDENGPGTGAVAYKLTATASDGPACTNAASCVQGGTYSDENVDDATAQLVCNTTSGMCEQSGSTGLQSAAPGTACGAESGVFTAGICQNAGFCAAATCITTCKAQADCDAAFGAGKAQCILDTFRDDLCLPNCNTGAASSQIWGDAQCQELFESNCNATSMQCDLH